MSEGACVVRALWINLWFIALVILFIIVDGVL